MDENVGLERIVGRQREKETEGAVRLGEVIGRLMETQVLPLHTRFGSVGKVWYQLLPAELAGHCEPADVADGRLRVEVDLPAYMHELRMRQQELLEGLRRFCPKARIREIKFVIR